MGYTRSNEFILPRYVAPIAALLVCKVTLSIVSGYGDYLPPNFGSDFLLGREKYFWGAYGCAFYVHIAAGPLSLMLGTLLIVERFRRVAPAWHRRLGRVQAVCILSLVVPSGLWMAWYAATGAVAAAGLGSLAIATAVCAALGWKAAVARRLADHRRWMWRTYLLLCSAVIIRMVGGLATICQFDALWLYPFSTWASWLTPLLIFESLGSLSGNVVVVAGD